MNRFLIGIAAASALCDLACAQASTPASVPLWEAGVGVAGLTLHAYRGSDKTHNYVLPVPYIIYNGHFLKADRHGVRGELFDSDRIELSINTSASPPTKSDDLRVRKGMPDLKPTVEIGPELDITLWRGAGALSFLKLRLPVRQAFTAEKNPRDIGSIFSPNLNADIREPFGMPGWTLGFVTGPIYASARQHAYFYGVDARYATATRPVYAAAGGYGGWQCLASLSKRFDRMWVGAYMRADTLDNAAFDDSPLVARDSYLSAGFAVSWIVGRSTTMVEAER